jgi:ArsR family transcriptional regulator
MAALAEPTRARTLRLVERHELAVAELCAILQLPQSTVSRHLKVLADDGWVAARSEGTSRFYRLPTDSLDPAARRLWSLLREQSAGTPISEQDDRRLTGVLAERRSRSQNFFNSAAGQWDRMRHELFGERFDLLGLAGLLDDSWVVGDLGCGTGQIAATLAPFVNRVIAVESARAMLAAARRRLDGIGNVNLRRGELEALPIDDEQLDAAVIGLVLHHLSDPLAALRETARVLRPGGRLLVIDMFAHDHVEYRQQMGHVWLGFESSQILAWLDQAGYESRRLHALPAHPHAKGPGLFVATGKRGNPAEAASPRNNGGAKRHRKQGR